MKLRTAWQDHQAEECAVKCFSKDTTKWREYVRRFRTETMLITITALLTTRLRC